MLRRLLEMEVPEINQGLVEIKAIAREAGKRAKVAVAATRDGVDPVGACVGLRGVRIQSIVRDLNDEKIDVIEWNPESAAFISKALSPARVSGVFLDEDVERGKTAAVVVPEDQLSLAIGRAGVNARLAARLTNWRIDIKSLVEAATESLNRLATDDTFAEMAEAEAETMPQIEMILTKKAETRPVTPEEYHLLTDFVVRVEDELMARKNAERQVYLEKVEKIREAIPEGAYHVTLVEVGISTRVANLLAESGYETAGKTLEQLEIDEDKILALQGVGPKAITELKEILPGYDYPEPIVEEELVEEEEELAAEDADVEGEAEAEAEAGAEDAQVEAEGEAEAEPTAEVDSEAEPEAIPIEEAFAQAIEEVTQAALETDDDEATEAEKEAERKKRKQRARVVEYDPDLGETVVRHRRKASRQTDWQDVGEFDDNK
jgi:N utilization substance protein A